MYTINMITKQVENEKTSIGDLYNKSVFTVKGKYVGAVDDIVLDFENKRIDGIVLNDANETLRNELEIEAKKVIIPFEWVVSNDDIVITTDCITRIQ